MTGSGICCAPANAGTGTWVSGGAHLLEEGTAAGGITPGSFGRGGATGGPGSGGGRGGPGGVGTASGGAGGAGGAGVLDQVLAA